LDLATNVHCKALRQALPIRQILRTRGKPNLSTLHSLDPLLEQRPVIHAQERFADMHSIVRVDADKICVERCVVQLGQRQTIGDKRLP
jgi:hypothetical protein